MTGIIKNAFRCRRCIPPRATHHHLHSQQRHVHQQPNNNALVKHLTDTIKISGPITVAQYMRQALTNPLGGYYMHKDVFGQRGDFVTSPEISQLSGEMVGIWIRSTWEKLDRKSNEIQLTELGPGRGTLMADVLRILKNFPYLLQTIKSIHLIEASPHLQTIQAKTLGVASTSLNKETQVTTGTTPQGIQVNWYTDISQVPITQTTQEFLLAHEFLDALPIHKFQFTQHGWRELMVDINDNTQTINSNVNDNKSNSPFRLTLSKSPTPSCAFLSLPSIASHINHFANPGTHIEISPSIYTISESIAQRVSQSNGAALIMDYGKFGPSSDSMRGIKDHTFVDWLSNTGNVDLSADVDFGLVGLAIQETGAKGWGPTTQSSFLHSMGIGYRLQQLLSTTQDTKVQKELVNGYRRLTETNAMGRIYKVIGVTSNGVEGIVGFDELPNKSTSK